MAKRRLNTDVCGKCGNGRSEVRILEMQGCYDGKRHRWLATRWS